MTSRCYDLYGTKARAIDELVVEVRRAAGVDFRRHESGYLGGEYLLAGDLRNEHFVLQQNRVDDDPDDEYAEPAFSDYSVLLQVNATLRADELRAQLAAIAGLDFLRRAAP